MFDHAGRLEDLTEAIEASADYSDEELQSIVKNTTRTITKEEQEKNISNEIKSVQDEIQSIETSIANSSDYLNSYKRKKSPSIKYKRRDEKGKYVHEEKGTNASREAHIQFVEDEIEAKEKRIEELNQRLTDLQKQSSSINEKSVGPFIDNNGNPMYATAKGKQEMINKLKQNHEDIINTINNYKEIKDEITLKVGQQLSDEQLEELTWMKSQIGNWAKRAGEMSGEVKDIIGNVLGRLESQKRVAEAIREREGSASTDISKNYRKADDVIQSITKAIETLNIVRSLDNETMAATLAQNPNILEGLKVQIDKLDNNVLSADDKENVLKKLNDLSRLGNASRIYQNKFMEYLFNPQKQAEDHAKVDK